jgi:hypothetical protein
MKKFSLGLALILMAATFATAQATPSQAAGPAGPGQGMMQAANQQAPVAPKAVHLEGKLAFVDDQPVLQTKEGSYLIRMPRFYYYAYTEAFKAGDAMKLDGFVITAPAGAASQGTAQQAAQQQVIFVTKAVVGSKTYDFSASYGRGGMMGGRGGLGGRGGMGCFDTDGRGQGNRGGRW